jgi:hypothetical protein
MTNGKNHWYLLNRSLSGLWNQTGCFGEEKILTTALNQTSIHHFFLIKPTDTAFKHVQDGTAVPPWMCLKAVIIPA